MKAKIKVWGKSYNVLNVSWYKDGQIAHACFEDEDGTFYTFFNNPIEDNTEDMKGLPDTPIQANLEKRIDWDVSK